MFVYVWVGICVLQIQAANDIGFGPESPIVFGYSSERSD